MADHRSLLKIDCPSCGATNTEEKRYQLLNQYRILLVFQCGNCEKEYQAVFDMQRIQVSDSPLIVEC